MHSLHNLPSISPLLLSIVFIPRAGACRIPRAMLARALFTYTTPIPRAGTRHIRSALLAPPLLGSIVRRQTISSVGRRNSQLILGRLIGLQFLLLPRLPTLPTLIAHKRQNDRDPKSDR